MKNADNIQIILLPEQFDVRSIAEVEELWDKTLHKKPEIIGMDCGNLRFIDSSAIGTLVKFYNSSLSHNIEMHLFDLNSDLTRIFEATKISRLISVISKDKFLQHYDSVSLNN